MFKFEVRTKTLTKTMTNDLRTNYDAETCISDGKKPRVVINRILKMKQGKVAWECVAHFPKRFSYLGLKSTIYDLSKNSTPHLRPLELAKLP